jgi:hypothetical protein
MKYRKIRKINAVACLYAALTKENHKSDECVCSRYLWCRNSEVLSESTWAVIRNHVAYASLWRCDAIIVVGVGVE